VRGRAPPPALDLQLPETGEQEAPLADEDYMNPQLIKVKPCWSWVAVTSKESKKLRSGRRSPQRLSLNRWIRSFMDLIHPKEE